MTTNLIREITDEGVPNFHAVTDEGKSPFLFRGGQPTEEGFASLKREVSVETVVCLRNWNNDWEKDLVSSLGMQFVYLPLPLKLSELSGDQFPEAVRTFFSTIRSAKRNIFVHCHQGIDRTGLMVALYRIGIDQWNFDAAFAEMERCGYQGEIHQVFLSKFKETLYDWWSNSRCASI